MDYKQYQKSRNMSWEILVKENIKELPVNIVELCHKLGIAVKYYDKLEQGNDGKCTVINKQPIILVRQECSRQRKRFTIAHELGHILLGHVGKYELVNREISPTDNPIEQEANVFASRLLAPACVLWGLKVKSADEIAQICDISLTAAEYRWQRMQELYKRNKFLVAPLEREVFNQFQEFISNHRHLANP
jgi:Zn-dependent peptidase ImmA (M78 family)